MAAHFKVDGREYPLPDFETITFREARAVKAATGLRMGELPAAFEAGDTDAYLALFIVSKMRVDGPAGITDLDDLAVTALEFGGDEEDNATGPLERPAQPKRSSRKSAAANS
jgi:hypothetical protein